MKTHWLQLSAALLAGLASNLQSAELGMPAPPLAISDWVKGEPQDLAKGKGKTTYVVEFWATWCPPCRTSIPHLTEVQKKFKDRDVVVIGISDETLDKVKPFVQEMGDKMAYVVAIDQDKKSSAGYMEAFGEGGIPHAFIVDKQGRVAWHGHPMGGMDSALEDILSGTYDLDAAKRAKAAEKAMVDYFTMASEETFDSQAAAELGQQVVRDLTGNPLALNQFAWVVLTHPRIKHRDTQLAKRAALLAYNQTEGNDPAITDTYTRALFDTGSKEEAIALQKKAIAACDNPDLRAQMEKALKEYEAGVQ